MRIQFVHQQVISIQSLKIQCKINQKFPYICQSWGNTRNYYFFHFYIENRVVIGSNYSYYCSNSQTAIFYLQHFNPILLVIFLCFFLFLLLSPFLLNIQTIKISFFRSEFDSSLSSSSILSFFYSVPPGYFYDFPQAISIAFI